MDCRNNRTGASILTTQLSDRSTTGPTSILKGACRDVDRSAARRDDPACSHRCFDAGRPRTQGFPAGTHEHICGQGSLPVRFGEAGTRTRSESDLHTSSDARRPLLQSRRFGRQCFRNRYDAHSALPPVITRVPLERSGQIWTIVRIDALERPVPLLVSLRRAIASGRFSPQSPQASPPR